MSSVKLKSFFGYTKAVLILATLSLLLPNSLFAELSTKCQNNTAYYNMIKNTPGLGEVCQNAKAIAFDQLDKYCNTGDLNQSNSIKDKDGNISHSSSKWDHILSQLESKCSMQDIQKNCKEDKEKFEEYFTATTNACTAIIGKFDSSEGNNLKQCAQRTQLCLTPDEDEDRDEEYKKLCSWVALSRVEDVQEQQDLIEKNERELMNDLTENQVNASKTQENKRKQINELNSELQKIQLAIAESATEMQNLSLKTDAETQKQAANLRTQLTQLKTQLSAAKAADVMSIEQNYLNQVRAAQQTCEVEAKLTYEDKKKKIQSKIQSGLSIAQVNKLTKNSKVQSITYLKNTCMDSDSNYLNAVRSAGEQRIQAITANKTKIANLEESIRNAIQSYNESIDLLKKNNMANAQKLEAKRASFNLESQRIQQQIQELSRPSQSDMFAQMQQQQSTIKELEALSSAKTRTAEIGKYGINKDDFKYLRSLADADLATYESAVSAFTASCCVEGNNDSLCKKVQGSGASWGLDGVGKQ